jgi:hypothetical protein
MFIAVDEPKEGTFVIGPFHDSFSEGKLKVAFIPSDYTTLNADWLAERMSLHNIGDVDALVRMICTVLALKEPANLTNAWRMDEFDQEEGLKSFGYALSIETSRHLAKRLGLTPVTSTQREGK